jgi:hypothetical protein
VLKVRVVRTTHESEDESSPLFTQRPNLPVAGERFHLDNLSRDVARDAADMSMEDVRAMSKDSPTGGVFEVKQVSYMPIADEVRARIVVEPVTELRATPITELADRAAVLTGLMLRAYDEPPEDLRAMLSELWNTAGRASDVAKLTRALSQVDARSRELYGASIGNFGPVEVTGAELSALSAAIEEDLTRFRSMAAERTGERLELEKTFYEAADRFLRRLENRPELDELRSAIRAERVALEPTRAPIE